MTFKKIKYSRQFILCIYFHFNRKKFIMSFTTTRFVVLLSVNLMKPLEEFCRNYCSFVARQGCLGSAKTRQKLIRHTRSKLCTLISSGCDQVVNNFFWVAFLSGIVTTFLNFRNTINASLHKIISRSSWIWEWVGNRIQRNSLHFCILRKILMVFFHVPGDYFTY